MKLYIIGASEYVRLSFAKMLYGIEQFGTYEQFESFSNPSNTESVVLPETVSFNSFTDLLDGFQSNKVDPGIIGRFNGTSPIKRHNFRQALEHRKLAEGTLDLSEVYPAIIEQQKDKLASFIATNSRNPDLRELIPSLSFFLSDLNYKGELPNFDIASLRFRFKIDSAGSLVTDYAEHRWKSESVSRKITIQNNSLCEFLAKHEVPFIINPEHDVETECGTRLIQEYINIVDPFKLALAIAKQYGINCNFLLNPATSMREQLLVQANLQHCFVRYCGLLPLDSYFADDTTPASLPLLGQDAYFSINSINNRMFTEMINLITQMVDLANDPLLNNLKTLGMQPTGTLGLLIKSETGGRNTPHHDQHLTEFAQQFCTFLTDFEIKHTLSPHVLHTWLVGNGENQERILHPNAIEILQPFKLIIAIACKLGFDPKFVTIGNNFDSSDNNVDQSSKRKKSLANRI